MDILDVLRDMGIGAGRRLKGTAVHGDIRSGKTALNASGDVTGTLAVRDGAGAVAVTPGTTNQTLSAGIYDNSISIAGDADLVTGNIRAGVNLFGVAGKASVVDTASATAVAANILAGITAFINGVLVTGTMPNRDYAWHAPIRTVGREGGIYVVPPNGWYPGVDDYANRGGVDITDPDFISPNFLATKNIFGLQGGIPVRQFSGGNSPTTTSLHAHGVSVEPNGNNLFMLVPQGYYDGSTWLGIAEPELIASNFLSTAQIGNDSAILQGSIPNYSSQHVAATAVDGSSIAGRIYIRPSVGYYDGSISYAYYDDPDFVAANVPADKNIFGLQGTIPISWPTLGDSIAALSIMRYSGWDGSQYALMQISANTLTRGVNWVRVYEPDMLPQNVLTGKTIWGMAGTAKRTASGVAVASATQLNFNRFYFETDESQYYFEVSGLSFTPSRIVISLNSNPHSYMTTYDRYIITASYHNASTESTILRTYRGNVSSAYITNGGFRLPVINAPSYNMTWYAAE